MTNTNNQSPSEEIAEIFEKALKKAGIQKISHCASVQESDPRFVNALQFKFQGKRFLVKIVPEE
jgi:hypothetical protein